MRHPLFGDQADFQLTNGHSAVRAIEMCVHARAGVKFEHAPVLDYPDARERRVEVFDNGFGASLQHVPECAFTSERGADVGSHCDLSRVVGDAPAHMLTGFARQLAQGLQQFVASMPGAGKPRPDGAAPAAPAGTGQANA